MLLNVYIISINSSEHNNANGNCHHGNRRYCLH